MLIVGFGFGKIPRMAERTPEQGTKEDGLVEPMDVVQELMRRFDEHEKAGFESPESHDTALVQLVKDMAAVISMDPALREKFLIEGENQQISDEVVH